MNTEHTGPSRSTNNTRTVARNSFWYGLEVVFGMVGAFGTSIAVANVLGPVRLSYYQFIVLLTSITIAVGAFGLPATTCKYMAEYLNTGEPGIARAIYLSTLKIQTGIALGIAALSMVAVFWLGDPDYRIISVLLVAAMVPRLVATVPSQANNASEVMRRNTGPSLAGVIATVVLTIVSLIARWDLIGLASAVLIGALLECVLKLMSVERWMRGVGPGTVSPELRRRMFAYSGQGLALMILNIVVWDKSDVFILKALNHDPTQITFFSYAFNLTERILMIPTMFGGSLSATLMAQYGRGQARLKEMTVDGARYALLISMPLLLGLACISKPLIHLLYVPSYRPLAATLAIVALMAIPKSLVTAPTVFLQAMERQGFLIVWGCCCGAVDIALDVLLTPQYGANGAALANGAAQTMAAIGIWTYAWKSFNLDLKLLDVGRIVISGLIMAGGVIAFTRAVPGNLGLFASIVIGAALWVVGLRVTSALKPADLGRFFSVGGQLPGPLRPSWKRLVGWLAPAA